jgi:hypothetical protein
MRKFRATRTTPTGTFGARVECDTEQQARDAYAWCANHHGVTVTVEKLEYGQWIVLSRTTGVADMGY